MYALLPGLVVLGFVVMRLALARAEHGCVRFVRNGCDDLRREDTPWRASPQPGRTRTADVVEQTGRMAGVLHKPSPAPVRRVKAHRRVGATR